MGIRVDVTPTGYYLDHDAFSDFMNRSGLEWRFLCQDSGHIQVGPHNNLRPWTTERETEVRESLTAQRVRTTKEMVRGDYTKHTLSPGYGFRIY